MRDVADRFVVWFDYAFLDSYLTGAAIRKHTRMVSEWPTLDETSIFRNMSAGELAAHLQRASTQQVDMSSLTLG